MNSKSREMSDLFLQSALLRLEFNHEFFFAELHNVPAVIFMLDRTLEEIPDEVVWVENTLQVADWCISHFEGEWRTYFCRFEDATLGRSLGCFRHVISTACYILQWVIDRVCGLPVPWRLFIWKDAKDTRGDRKEDCNANTVCLSARHSAISYSGDKKCRDRPRDTCTDLLYIHILFKESVISKCSRNLLAVLEIQMGAWLRILTMSRSSGDYR